MSRSTFLLRDPIIRENVPMATVDQAGLVFYPAFCFKASPTHFAWVKMAAADVQRLQQVRGFEGQKIYFYNNHPIRFVSIAGVIVTRSEVPRRTILEVDDSSGAMVEVVISHSDPPAGSMDMTSNTSTRPPIPQQSDMKIKPEFLSNDTAEEASGVTTRVTSNQPNHVSATDRTILDTTRLNPGTMVNIKGTLSQFRGNMQLQLERFTILSETNAEMEFVDARLRFLVEVLSVPWVLDEVEIEQLRTDVERGDLEVLERRQKAEERVKRRAEREERHQRHILRRYEKEERRRDREANACREEGARIMEDIRRRRGGS
ncbi:hypothetical protein N7492_005990 [Penicillium capsulatum]|uniref:CST complex subunit Stn1 N-terminal domain-containing protein n=1 Tax=Penicillium capsulatum TaxID=69766 RepID=A0A9W9LRN5_9EURO|nr:hypothetical protein N7492_005990 [Penicillium capsulatum]KAJ6134906.1 hypothetical protein N7512_000066 [Penicillium capsulatum]